MLNIYQHKTENSSNHPPKAELLAIQCHLKMKTGLGGNELLKNEVFEVISGHLRDDIQFIGRNKGGTRKAKDNHLGTINLLITI